MMTYRKQTRDSRKGQSTIAITLSLILLFGILGLVVDVGWAYWRWEACKAAADSAAFAAAMVAKGASNLTCGSGVVCQSATTCPASLTDNNNAIQVGCKYAQDNGFVQGGVGGRQSVYMAAGVTGSPTTGTAPNYWVTATVVEKQPQLFSAVLGKPWMTVSARSTTNVYVGAGGGCIFVLDPTAAKAYKEISSNITTGCGLYVDSNASNAVYVESATLTVGGGASVITAGNVSLNSASITYNGGGSTKTGQPRHGDPFSGMTEPTPSTPCIPDPNLHSAGQTLNPGTYCSITLNSASNTTFNPGVYIISNGNINITSSDGVNANGVTFYFPGSSGNISFTSGGLNLTAPSSGPTAGIAIWKGGPSSSSTVLDSSTITINGVIYMPYTNLTYGSSTASSQTTIVADTLKIDSCNITNAASSPFFTGGGGSLGGVFAVE